MKKILVIGCPGSGKSYFSGKLAEITGIPLCHLDMLYWNADRTNVTREVFLERLNKVLETESFIIDGNFSVTLEHRLNNSDTVFFFDLPVEVCIEGILQRRGKPRPDLPWNEADYPVDEEFLTFVRNFEKDRKPNILSLLEKYSDREIITFRSRAEVNEFIEKCKVGICRDAPTGTFAVGMPRQALSRY